MKICNKCNVEKELSCYTTEKRNGREYTRNVCKKCKSKQCKPESQRARSQRYEQKNKHIRKDYRTKNRKILTAKEVARYHTDTEFRLRKIIRSSIKGRVKRFKGLYNISGITNLGCTIPEFKIYIESKFTEGMSWDNQSLWHLDHIRPLVSFDLSNEQEFKTACHFTNYQPLWAKDNLRKSDKYE